MCIPLYGLHRYLWSQKVWFSAISVLNRVLILAILLIEYGLHWVCFLEEAPFSGHK